jgi:hypothetical protein
MPVQHLFKGVSDGNLTCTRRPRNHRHFRIFRDVVGDYSSSFPADRSRNVPPRSVREIIYFKNQVLLSRETHFQKASKFQESGSGDF